MATEETPADRLRTAAAYVCDNHTRSELVNDAGQVCAVGAILGLECVEQLEHVSDPMMLLSADLIAYEAVKALAEFLVGSTHARIGAVETWNDYTARDGAEVAAAMEKAAAQWEERHG
jgi:hypothetical protein